MDDEVEVLDLYDDDKDDIKNNNIELMEDEVLSSTNNAVLLEKSGLLDHLVVSKGYWFVVLLTMGVIVILFIMMFK